MKNENISLTGELAKEIQKLKQCKIDLSDEDAPEIVNWEKSVVGKYYRPVKKQITIRIDAEVLDWFKHTAEKYQPLINQACREYMEHHSKLRKNK